MRYLATGLIALALSLVTLNASAYYVFITGQAGANNDNPVYSDQYQIRIDDGATSVAYNTGIISGSSFLSGTAESRAEADLAKGVLKTFAEATGNQIATAQARLYDLVSFKLPEGVTSTLVTASLTIEGTLEGAYSMNSVDTQRLIFGGGSEGQDSILLSDLTTPHTLSVTFEVEEDRSYVIDALIGGRIFLNRTAATYGKIDLSNTAFLDLTVEEGVSFSSESGVLLTSPVALPAAAWLFGSALLGLSVIKRRKV